MMFEELVKRLRNLSGTDNIAEFDEAADAIEELDTLLDGVSADNDALCETIERLKKPRWIPASERLPEKRKWVLCQCQANITDVLRFENAEWYHDPTHVYMFDFVTHWMPLPDPPKKEVEYVIPGDCE